LSPPLLLLAAYTLAMRHTERRASATDLPYNVVDVGSRRVLWMVLKKLESGSIPNVMVALPNIVGALCSAPQSLADAHY